MDTNMELDDFKSAWQSLDRKLERDHRIQKRLFLEHRLDKTRSSLRPLAFGQVMQMLLGIALIVLGVACWRIEIPGYLVSGTWVHAFGVVNVALAGITPGRSAASTMPPVLANR
jgi:serine/threonine-protein kinase